MTTSYKSKILLGTIVLAIVSFVLVKIKNQNIPTQAIIGDTDAVAEVSPKKLVTRLAKIGDIIGDTAKTTVVSPIMSPILSPTISVTPTVSPIVVLETIQWTPAVSSVGPEYTATPSPSEPARVIINEIAWMGTNASANDEWIELYNPTGMTIDLAGWTLKSITGSSPDPQITLKGTIQSHAYFLLERTNDSTVSDITADQIYTGALNDTGESLELRDATGNLMDLISKSVDNKWFAGDKVSRSTMERIDSSQPGDLSGNWGTNISGSNNKNAAGQIINGTPKARNSISNN